MLGAPMKGSYRVSSEELWRSRKVLSAEAVEIRNGEIFWKNNNNVYFHANKTMLLIKLILTRKVLYLD